jgi:hypothetical protein
VATVNRKRKVCYSRAQVLLRNQFRLLWEQHVYWTRMVILGIAFASPDLAATTERLLRNVPDFEAVLRRFYRPGEVRMFGVLLKDHLVIAADLVRAAKAGDSEAVAELEKRWYANADEIVQLMHRMNPFWLTRVLRPMWHRHLALTQDEAVETLTGQYAKGISTFDEIEKLAMTMADEFARGIIKQRRV